MFKIIRRIIFCLIIIVAVFCGLQWKNYQKKSACRDDALLYFNEEDYEKSISYLEKGLKYKSVFGKDMDDDMSCYLGESYYQLGDYEKVVKIYNSLIDTEPKKEEYYLLKAEAYEALGENEKAVSVLEKGWKKTKDSEFLVKICDSYIKEGDYEQALKYVQEGIDASDDNAAEFLYKKIVIYEKDEDYQSAYDAASAYVSQYPDDEKGQKELKFLETRI